MRLVSQKGIGVYLDRDLLATLISVKVHLDFTGIAQSSSVVYLADIHPQGK